MNLIILSGLVTSIPISLERLNSHVVDKFIKEKELLKSWDKFQVDYTHVTEVVAWVRHLHLL